MDLARILPRTVVRRTRKQARRVTRVAARERKRLPKRITRARRRAARIWNARARFTYASSLAYVPARAELPAVLNRRRLFGDAAEIGVKLGKYSDHLLTHWRGRRLISIDPWLEVDPAEYVDHSNVPQDVQEQYYGRTRELLGRHGSRSEIWRTTSVEAAERIADGTLDFVYIDARHDYESVMEDLAAWFPKVRPGGLIAGHDYMDGRFYQGVFGVKRAVDEFFGARGVTVYSTRGQPPAELFPSWIVEVPAGD
jgi:Methyltransferase domain